MLSKIPASGTGSTQFLYHPTASLQPGGGQPGNNQAALSAAAAAAAAAEHAIHFRSASMPESVYLHRVNAAAAAAARHQAVQVAGQPSQAVVTSQAVVQAAGAAAVAGQYFKPVTQRHRPALTGLRRSATNAADFQARRMGALRVASDRAQGGPQAQGWAGSQVDLNVARSRTNIAALGGHMGPGAPSGAVAQGHLPHQQRPSGNPRQISRASSFYHPAASAGFALKQNSLTRVAKDVSKPLHVDCSIEYDLGAQPKIPKDSAPLLIIHPDYRTVNPKKQHQPTPERFHPYVGLPNSGASGVSRHPSSAAANGSLTHSSQQSTTTRTPQNQHLRSQSNAAAADKCRSAPAADRQNNSRTNSTVESHRSNLPSSATKISRHQSFLVTGSQGGYQLHPHGISQPVVQHHLHPTNGVHGIHRQTALLKSSSNLAGSSSQFRASDLNLLHLSMPDISVDDEDDEELIRYHQIATMRQQRTKAQTSVKKQPQGAAAPSNTGSSSTFHPRPNYQVRRGQSMVSSLTQPLNLLKANPQGQHHPKARLNLEAKLNEIELKEVSERSADIFKVASVGGKRQQPVIGSEERTPSSEASAHNYSFEFKELDEEENGRSNDADQGFESFVSAHQAHHTTLLHKQSTATRPEHVSGSHLSTNNKPINIHPVRHLALSGGNNTFCDSGLGTPSSLIGSSSPHTGAHTRSQSTSSSSASRAHSFLGNSLSRWKSSVSGLVTGFMCCAARSGRRENYSTRVVSTPTFHFQPKMATPVGVTGGPDAHVVAQTDPIQASLSPPSSEDVADNVRQHCEPVRKWSASGSGSSSSGVSSHAESRGWNSPEAPSSLGFSSSQKTSSAGVKSRGRGNPDGARSSSAASSSSSEASSASSAGSSLGGPLKKNVTKELCQKSSSSNKTRLSLPHQQPYGRIHHPFAATTLQDPTTGERHFFHPAIHI